MRNIRANIRRPLPQVQVHDVNDYEAILLCGGPSLEEQLPWIKRRRKAGAKLITVNGAHNWCLENGLTPSLHVMLDARAFNKRFVETPVDSCRYLVCAQCPASVFEALEGHDVHIWHASAPDSREGKVLDEYYLRRWTPVMGGCTVGSRAIGLAAILGIRKLSVCGMDSCFVGDQHHAYEQRENDGAAVHRVRVGHRVFHATGWMLKQADEMFQLASVLPEDMQMRFRGDGLISW